ncbi:uncharacterized protein KGF55_004627 [Candida pseudojiufengensis]|uniref:uncharacterized protein n=1 Tax=Candida pseudojiufengensis TaxID=497109 RepID=UPI002224E5E0|nr:uncharacterized protein KGF55_004627 [Candida pseudojiufengensis]KAI5960335.1 hypothetical protein KGF55_004627 [Candida pseudojiufengensis]
MTIPYQLTSTTPLQSTSSNKHLDKLDTLSNSNNQLNTPPTSPTPDQIKEIYKQFNIELHQSNLMPQPSKIKHGNPFSWSEITYIINSNALELFARNEKQTEEYHKFKQFLKDSNISINDYILKHELHWKSSDIRFQEYEVAKQYDIKHPQDLIFYNDSDIIILPNKFPYYFEKGIVHLCIWSKLIIPNDPNSEVGDISEITKKIIDKYLKKTFIEKGVDPKDIVWFKNWTSLQSVRSISHIHVILNNNVDPNLINKLINTCGTTLDLNDYKEILETN